VVSGINTRSKGIVLLDRGRVWHEGDGIVVHWAAMDVPDGHVSIPLLVNEQLDVLRKEYLSWIYDLCETRIQGKSVREHLKIDEGFSFWWMTLLAEKAPLKTQSIYTVFKLRVFEKFYLDSGYKKIILYSNDRALRNVVSRWCKELGHTFRWKRERKEGQFRFNLRRVYKAMPPPFQAFYVLLRSLLSRRLFLKPISEIPFDKRQATIVTYFPNIDMQKANEGVFRSRYWEQLDEVLDKGPWGINWIWIYVNDGLCSFGKAVKFRRKFQNNEKGGNKYYFLEEFMNVEAVCRAVILYFRIVFKAFRIRRFSKHFHFFHSSMNLWPAMAKDWYSSVLGSRAIDGCLMITTFQSLVSKLPDQEWGLYPYENQPWEKALIRAWKKKEHGKIYGFQHSTVRFSLLNYLEDDKIYNLKDYSLPLPDVIAVNGNGAKNLLEDVCFPKNKIRDVEALRYMYLKSLMTLPKTSDCKKMKNRLLVLTGISPEEVKRQLILLNRVGEQGALMGYDEVIIKPHPFCPVEPILAKVSLQRDFRVVDKLLSQIWPEVSVVYAAHSTSSGLEAVLCGLPVIIFLDECNLNLSPLYQWDGVAHVGRLKDLCEALQTIQAPPHIPDYFCLDVGLPRWRMLLGQ